MPIVPYFSKQVENRKKVLRDFGSAGAGDPAMDLAVASCYGEGFFELFCKDYGPERVALARARFY